MVFRAFGPGGLSSRAFRRVSEVSVVSAEGGS